MYAVFSKFWHNNVHILHDEFREIGDILINKVFALRNSMPYLNAVAATGCYRMLGVENNVTGIGCLEPISIRLGWTHRNVDAIFSILTQKLLAFAQSMVFSPQVD